MPLGEQSRGTIKATATTTSTQVAIPVLNDSRGAGSQPALVVAITWMLDSKQQDRPGCYAVPNTIPWQLADDNLIYVDLFT